MVLLKSYSGDAYTTRLEIQADAEQPPVRSADGEVAVEKALACQRGLADRHGGDIAGDMASSFDSWAV